MIENLQEFDLDDGKPDDLDDAAGATDKEIWKIEIHEFMKIKTYYRENKKHFYSIIRGQCTYFMTAKNIITTIT